MDEKTSIVARTRVPQHYGSDPVRFSGHPDALLERHLLFNDLIDPSTAGARQTFEAAARSMRDVLSRRWALTQRTYHRENPKRIYYLSMEFLIGRSLTNNITNLLLDRYVEAAAREASLDWLGLIAPENVASSAASASSIERNGVTPMPDAIIAAGRSRSRRKWPRGAVIHTAART